MPPNPALASEKQLSYLQGMGINTPKGMTSKDAAALLNQLTPLRYFVLEIARQDFGVDGSFGQYDFSQVLPVLLQDEARCTRIREKMKNRDEQTYAAADEDRLENQFNEEWQQKHIRDYAPPLERDEDYKFVHEILKFELLSRPKTAPLSAFYSNEKPKIFVAPPPKKTWKDWLLLFIASITGIVLAALYSEHILGFLKAVFIFIGVILYLLIFHTRAELLLWKYLKSKRRR